MMDGRVPAETRATIFIVIDSYAAAMADCEPIKPGPDAMKLTWS